MRNKFEKMYVKVLKLHIKEATKFLLDCRTDWDKESKDGIKVQNLLDSWK